MSKKYHIKMLELGPQGEAIDDSAHTYSLEEESTLFEQMSEQGEVLPHGCLSGSCGSCRILVTEGADNLSPAGTVESDTIQSLEEHYRAQNGDEFLKKGKIRLSCRAKIQGEFSFAVLK